MVFQSYYYLHLSNTNTDSNRDWQSLLVHSCLFLLSPCVLCGNFDYNKAMFKDKKYFGPPLGRPIFKPPVRGGFCTKKIYGDHFLVKHNPDNHFQGANPKFSLNLKSAPPLPPSSAIVSIWLTPSPPSGGWRNMWTAPKAGAIDFEGYQRENRYFDTWEEQRYHQKHVAPRQGPRLTWKSGGRTNP